MAEVVSDGQEVGAPSLGRLQTVVWLVVCETRRRKNAIGEWYLLLYVIPRPHKILDYGDGIQYGFSHDLTGDNYDVPVLGVSNIKRHRTSVYPTGSRVPNGLQKAPSLPI